MLNSNASTCDNRMRTFIQAITGCGDLAILLPLAGVLTIWAMVVGPLKMFRGWLAALALCIGGTAFLKIYFFACPPLSNLHSPSGHASLSILVYGALTLAVATATRDWHRSFVVVTGTTFIIAIGASRVILQDHTITEVVVGSLLGTGALSTFGVAYVRDMPAKRYLAPLITVCVLFIILLNGHELRAEELLHRIAGYLNIASGCSKFQSPDPVRT